MPIVDLEELRKQVKRKKEAKQEIEPIIVGDRTVFRGKELDDVFDSFDECLRANTYASQQADYKKRGLNKYGQNAQQAKNSDEKANLIKEREELLGDVRAIEIEIALLNRGKQAQDAGADKPKDNGKKKTVKRKTKKK